MMASRLFRLGLVVFLAGSASALTQPRVRAGHDLDTLSDAQLERDLADELDDIYGELDPDEEYSLDELHGAIMEALSDQGDEDDAEEAEIDEADLEGEMEEDDTTLEDVVQAALLEADEMASWRGSPSSSSGLATAAQDRNRRNGFSKPKMANQQVLRNLMSAIRAR
jgi:hypothetical protein